MKLTNSARNAFRDVRMDCRFGCICIGFVIGLVALSCTSSDSDNVASGRWRCVVSSGDSGGPICACGEDPPPGTPIDNAECRANEGAEWVRCAYSWEDGVCRCNADISDNTDTPGVLIWSCGDAEACPVRLVTQGEQCSQPGVMCPGGKTQDNIPLPYCICTESGSFDCTGN